MKRNRPWLVTFLALGVLMVAGIYLARLVRAIRLWEFNSQLPLSVSPLYLVVSGLVFSVAALLVFWGLWRGIAWAHRGTALFVLVVGLLYWIERGLLSRAAAARVNDMFVLGATILLIALAFLILSLPATSTFFAKER